MNTAGIGSESQEQRALIRWWELYAMTHGIPELLLFAIPNGGRRDSITGARLKAEGVRAGMPDLMLALPRGGAAGLFLELKRVGAAARPSGRQKEAARELAEAGYRVRLCRGWEAARREIESYLDQRAEGEMA